jgi:prepilin-type N-terminal cleavage/methylation domain-containing protein
MAVVTLIAVSLTGIAVFGVLHFHLPVVHRNAGIKHNSQRCIRRDSGFTIVELMVTLAVAVIVFTIAVPSFTTFISSNRLSSQANQFIAAMNFARHQAQGKYRCYGN